MTIRLLSIICGILLYRMVSLAQTNDFKFILHEETINKVFTALGPISGKSDYEVLLIKGHYVWTVKNPKIHVYKDSSIFVCDANVKAGGIDYNTPVFGYAKINYEQISNKISIQITKANFELYTKIFGKKIHIKNIDLAKYFKDPFLFDGPANMTTDFEFSVTDSTKKRIYIRPTTCELVTRKGEIITNCEIEASEKPFVKQVPTEVKK